MDLAVVRTAMFSMMTVEIMATTTDIVNRTTTTSSRIVATANRFAIFGIKIIATVCIISFYLLLFVEIWSYLSF